MAELRSCLPEDLRLGSPGNKTQATVSTQQISNWALKLQGEAEMTFKMAGGHSAQGHRHGPHSQGMFPLQLCQHLFARV